MVALSLVVIRAADIERPASFYTALGLDLHSPPSHRASEASPRASTLLPERRSELRELAEGFGRLALFDFAERFAIELEEEG